MPTHSVDYRNLCERWKEVLILSGYCHDQYIQYYLKKLSMKNLIYNELL